VIIPPVGSLTGELTSATQGGGLGHSGGVGQSEGLGQSEPTLGGAAGAGSEGGFGGALNNAIASLEQSQQSSDSAAQALATGTVSDPESAVVTVQDAQLEMQLASQIRTKATEAVQSIFQTQV
jgi:flagellar hook-basal body complex protein FliE